MTCDQPNATGNLLCIREPHDHGGHVWEHTVTHPEEPSADQ